MIAVRRWVPPFALALLAACVPPEPPEPGLSGRDAELLRQQGERGVVVLDVAPERAVFLARGQEVVVTPPKGHCVDGESLSDNGKVVFAMVSVCLARVEDPADVYPGILTLSISGEPAFQTEPEALDDFEAQLTSLDGLKLLGRGQSATPGSLVAIKRMGGVIYVLVEESAGGRSILSSRFWRAFVGVNDRLILATASGFKSRAVSDTTMLVFLARQIQALRRANAMPTAREEADIAALPVAPIPVAKGPVEAPLPPRRSG